MKPRTYSHPKPLMKKAIDIGALVTSLIMAMGAFLLLLLPLLGAPSGFLMATPLVLLLAAPVLMLTAYTPEVSVSDEGILLRPVVWKNRFVPWQDITAVKIYPLLPSEDEEVTRRYAVGKKHYRPAQGIMLIIPGLPWQYRIVGFFAGEGARPLIALTNRAHHNYPELLQIVLNATPVAIHDRAFLEDEE